MSSRGRHTSAIAITTRCRIPPLNSKGYCRARCGGVGDAHAAEHLHGAGERRRPAHPAVDPQRLGHLLAHAVDGAERGHRLLEDHPRPAAAHREQPRIARRQREDVDLLGLSAPSPAPARSVTEPP